MFKQKKRTWIHLFFITAVLAVFTAAASAQAVKKELRNTQDYPNYTVKKAVDPIKVDGILDERSWAEATVIKLPFEWTPGDNIPALVDTDFLVTFNENKLYMAFRCYDPDPSKIRAHLMDRDATDTLIQDDHVSIIIDFFNDERRGFQFRANPLGVQADAIFSEMEGYEDFSWDAIWKSAGQITDWGWAVEIAIPFNQVRFPKTQKIQTWGFSAERSYPRNVRHRLISHKRKRNINCILCQTNKVTGFQGMKTGLNLEIDPTLTANRTDTRENFPSGAIQNGTIKADPGVSLRWGITPNMILNATVNPDFSQVEADVQELNVNRRFAIRYPEKRPFFLEGADFFLTPLEAVFTRTVADPSGGFKFTGKIGKYAVGAFGAYDQINNLLFPSNQGSSSTSLDQNVGGGVFRFRRDVGQGSALGVLYTGRAAEDYYNHVAGADGFFRLSQTKTLSFQYLRSETDYSSSLSNMFQQKADPFGGGALSVEFSHRGRSWMYNASYRDISPGFRADYGYIPRVDMRDGIVGLSRLFWGKRGNWYNLIVVGSHAGATYDYKGNLTDRLFNVYSMYQGPLQTQVTLVYFNKREIYAKHPFDLNQFEAIFVMKPLSGLRFSLSSQFGDSIDYSNVRKAKGIALQPFVEFNLGRHFNVNLWHSYQRLNFRGEKIFTANLSQLRLIYNFSVRTFVRAIIQYLDVVRNPDLYLFPISHKTNTVFTQFLFSYKLNPQTVLFLGYSDNYLGWAGIDITQTNRTFFIKIGYAWLK